MFRKLKDQANRYNIAMGTIRGLLELGLPYAQTEKGTIFVSDDAMEQFFTDRVKTRKPAHKSAEALAAKVL